MKKIISLLCALAMLLSFTVVVSADANNYYQWTIKEKTANSVTLDLHFVTNATVSGFKAYYDFYDITSKGGSVATVAGEATPNWVAAQNMLAVAYAPTDGSTVTGDVVACTITISNITENFTIKISAVTNRTSPLVQNSAKETITNSFTNEAATINFIEENEEEITVKNEAVTEYTGEKSLIFVAKVLQKADASKKVVLTKNGEKQYSDRTLAQILGGVAATGSTLSGDVAIGVLTNDTTATFGFELVD